MAECERKRNTDATIKSITNVRFLSVRDSALLLKDFPRHFAPAETLKTRKSPP
jgi:hypothetical protein